MSAVVASLRTRSAGAATARAAKAPSRIEEYMVDGQRGWKDGERGAGDAFLRES